jgi:hypothetical protein
MLILFLSNVFQSVLTPEVVFVLSLVLIVLVTSVMLVALARFLENTLLVFRFFLDDHIVKVI